MTTVAVIADDLTGAADTGVQFCRLGNAVLLTDHVPVQHSRTGLAVYTRTRAADETAARRKLSEIGKNLATAPPDLVYKKIDSCLRGNIGAETEALMEALAMEASFIAPAFPAMGRTTVHDIHYVRGTPLARTEIARDPVTPVTDSRLSHNVMRQARLPVAHIGLPLLEGPRPSLVNHIAGRIAQGVRHLVFDARRQEHLDVIARLVRSPGSRILPVGSAGLAAGLSRRLAAESRPPADRAPDPLDRLAGPGLVVCGSASARCHRQIDVLCRQENWPVITISPDRLCDEVRRRALAAQAAPALARGHLAVRMAAPQTGENQAVISPRKRCRQLAAAVVGIMREVRPGGLLVTGGDTADALFREMKVEGMRLHGEVLTGLPAGVLAGGDFDGLAVVTKAGAFGDDTTLRDLFRRWQGESCD